MNDWIAIALAGLVAVLFALLVSLWGWARRRKVRSRQEDYSELARAVGLARVSDRLLYGTRIIRLAGLYQGHSIEVEIGHADGQSYTRIDLKYPNPLMMGVRILSEETEGLWTRLVRMRESKIEVPAFDPHFILLTRDDERLKAFLDRDLRRMLLDLRYVSGHLRLGDEGIHLSVPEAATTEKLQDIMQLAARVANYSRKRAEEINREAERAAAETYQTAAFTPLPGTLQAVDSENRAP